MNIRISEHIGLKGLLIFKGYQLPEKSIL